MPRVGHLDRHFYNWRSKYSGMEVADAKHLKALETENARLKKLLAEALLGNEVTKDVLSKMYGPPRVRKGRLARRAGFCTNVSGLLIGRCPWP